MTATPANELRNARRWLPATVLGAAALLWYFALALIIVSRLFPLLAGWTPAVITSGSMEPAIHAGDVVVYGPTDGVGLETGRVITFVSPADPTRLITHRIEAVNEDGSYTTRGDNNRLADSTPVGADSIRGVGRLVVPLAGLPLLWFERGNALLLSVFLILLIGSKGYMSWAETKGAQISEPSTGPEGKRNPLRRRFVVPTRAVVVVVAITFVAGTAMVGAAFSDSTPEITPPAMSTSRPGNVDTIGADGAHPK